MARINRWITRALCGLIIVSLLFSVGLAEDNKLLFGIYNANDELLIELGCPARDVIDKLGLPTNAYDPYVIYDKSKITIPEVKEPVMRPYAQNIEMIKALLDAAPNEWDVLDTEGAAMALDPFGLTVKEFIEKVGDIIYVSERDIERGILDHSYLETIVHTAETQLSIYETELENYNAYLSTPYDQWIEDIGSSLVITGQMLGLMAQDGGNILYSLVYDGLTITLTNEKSFLLEKKPAEYFFVFLRNKLEDTEYNSIEERNLAIEKAADEYRELYIQWTNLIIDSSTVTTIKINKPGYKTGRDDYVGKAIEDSSQSYLTDYYSGVSPLSRDYIASLTSEEKSRIPDLRYYSLTLGGKSYVSDISIGIYPTYDASAVNTYKELTTPRDNLDTETTIDDVFIKDLLHGFTERDRLINSSGNRYGNTVDISWVITELDYLEKYRTSEFVDESVKYAALVYIDGLDRQRDAISKYAKTNQELYDQYWADGYYERCRAFYLLSQKYDLKVVITLREALDKMISIGEYIDLK